MHQAWALFYVHTTPWSDQTVRATCSSARGTYPSGLLPKVCTGLIIPMLTLHLRQANMDYLFFSAVMGVLLALMISYDIVCQWYQHLWARMINLPPAMQIAGPQLPTVQFGIPKEHIWVHGPGHSKFSFNFLRWVCQTYGEGVESHWAFMNPIALSACEMSLSSRQELMNDHGGCWNWRKIVAFGMFSC